MDLIFPSFAPELKSAVPEKLRSLIQYSSSHSSAWTPSDAQSVRPTSTRRAHIERGRISQKSPCCRQHDAMNRRPSALTVRRRSSVIPAAQLTRRASAISNAESGYDEAAVTADQAIHEEIDEIKRYEDFTTIDWVQDAAREQLRRKARRQEAAGFFERNGRLGWRRKLWESYDAGQAWIVVTLIGAAIGLNAAFLNIVTEWLSDMKLGYCTTAFYLNENFCCWGAESGCAEWHRWSSFWPINYLFYIVFSVGYSPIPTHVQPADCAAGCLCVQCGTPGEVLRTVCRWVWHF